MKNEIHSAGGVIAAFREKSAEARRSADLRRAELDEKFPEIAKIDNELENTGMKILLAAAEGKGNLEEKIKKLHESNDELLAFRAEFLKSHGYPEDYSDVHYDCPACSDTGYLQNGKMCDCLRRALAKDGFERSGIAKLAEKQNFDTFDLGYYVGASRENMEGILKICHGFVNKFDKTKATNLLFMGKTGLGKTHLSSSVAKELIERGYGVVYESAQNIISDFEKEKFSRLSDDLPDTQKYLECDLLIIDDLGTEMLTQFTVSCLYNLINSRIVNEKSMIISTNVERSELLSRYSERITSRLFGEFVICFFEGSDIRAAKLKR